MFVLYQCLTRSQQVNWITYTWTLLSTRNDWETCSFFSLFFYQFTFTKVYIFVREYLIVEVLFTLVCSGCFFFFLIFFSFSFYWYCVLCVVYGSRCIIGMEKQWREETKKIDFWMIVGQRVVCIIYEWVM